MSFNDGAWSWNGRVRSLYQAGAKDSSLRSTDMRGFRFDVFALEYNDVVFTILTQLIPGAGKHLAIHCFSAAERRA